MLSDAEQAVAVGSDHCLPVSVSWRPLIVVKGEEENVTVQKRGKRNAFCYDFREVSTEKEGADVVVLVLNDIVDDGSDSSILIGFKG